MIDIAQYICIEDLIAEKPATALGEITSLGLGGKLDFFIVLENVYVIWLAVFGDHKDCCGYHRTNGSEFFKITAESLEKLVVASKGGHVRREVQLELEVPGEVKEKYGLEPDYYTCELRHISRSDTLNTTSTIDIPVNQPSSNRDIFNKLDTVWTPGDIFEERDYVEWANSELDNAGWENFELGNAGWKIKVVGNLYWEKIEENDLVSLMGRNILQLWVVRDQAKRYFKETNESKISDVPPSSDNQSEDSYSDYKEIGKENLKSILGYKSWSGVRDLCKRYGVEIRHTDDGEPYLMISAVTWLNTKPRRNRKK